MLTQFNKISDAVAAGYEKSPLLKYRNFKILRKDISGGTSRGYSFGLFISPDYQCESEKYSVLWSPTLCDKIFGRSEEVYFKEEENKIKSLGAWSPYFSKKTIKKAFFDAIKAIDEFYKNDLYAQKIEKEAIEKEKKTQEKNLLATKKRAEKLALKYGEKLSSEWQKFL